MVLRYIVITLLCTNYVLCAFTNQRSIDDNIVNDPLPDVSQTIFHNINPDNIKANLRLFTKEPHLAGSDANNRLAEEIQDHYRKIGLTDVHTTSYEVLLSYPDFEKPNHIIINDKNGVEIFRSKGVSPTILPQEQSDKNAGHQWLAYSADGTVTAEVVYANRGKEADFDFLKANKIDVKGKIVLMRFGEGFRADKVNAAQNHGAVGAILFSDPSDVAQEGIEEENVYPKKLWMPGEAVQRGTLLHGNADPMTPCYPAKNGIYRDRSIEELKKKGEIPSIPVVPISYSTTYQILTRLGGTATPANWQGGINATYKTGPGFNNGEKLTLEVHASLETKKIQNVIGYIAGSEDPDSYVILGNHYDAWVYGSMDPNSGTAILAEVARAMMQTINETEWRPKKSIMFAAWDAEEYGLLGSGEFVEEFDELLNRRAIVYLNMDTLYGNMSLMAETIPTLRNVVVEASKKVPNPLKSERDRGRKTLYDTWIETFPGPLPGVPEMKIPGGSSDHAMFLTYSGVPVINFSFENKTHRDKYPLYHTMYETPFLNEHLFDVDNFAVHRAVGQFWTELALSFTDATIFPIKPSDLAHTILREYVPSIAKEMRPLEKFRDAIAPARRQLDHLFREAKDFELDSRLFEENIQSMAASAVNRRLTSIERCFINPRGISGVPTTRHVLFSLSDKDQYASSVMAGVIDAIDAFTNSLSESRRIEAGKWLAEQISIVQYSLICARNSFKVFI